MKRNMLGMLICLLVLGGAAEGLSADVTVETDIVSAYVWRGIIFNDGLVVQPSIDVSSNGFGINVWGNLDIDDNDDALDSGDFQEIDLAVYYGFSLNSIDVTVGYIEYLFPGGDPDAGTDDTREIYLSLSTEMKSGISFGFSGYYDFDITDDFYLDLFAGYSYEFSNGLGLGIGALAGYAGEDWSLGEDGGLHQYTFTAEVGYPITPEIGLSAFIAYTDTFDKDVLPEQDVDVFGGAGVTCAF